MEGGEQRDEGGGDMREEGEGEGGRGRRDMRGGGRGQGGGREGQREEGEGQGGERGEGRGRRERDRGRGRGRRGTEGGGRDRGRRGEGQRERDRGRRERDRGRRERERDEGEEERERERERERDRGRGTEGEGRGTEGEGQRERERDRGRGRRERDRGTEGGEREEGRDRGTEGGEGGGTEGGGRERNPPFCGPVPIFILFLFSLHTSSEIHLSVSLSQYSSSPDFACGPVASRHSWFDLDCDVDIQSGEVAIPTAVAEQGGQKKNSKIRRVDSAEAPDLMCSSPPGSLSDCASRALSAPSASPLSPPSASPLSPRAESVEAYIHQTKVHLREMCQVRPGNQIEGTLSGVDFFQREHYSYGPQLCLSRPMMSSQQETEAGLSLASHYVDVRLVQRQILIGSGKNANKCLEKDLVVMGDTERRRGSLARSQVFESSAGAKPKRSIVLLGNAGMGKSTLIKKLCVDWSDGLLPQFDFVFLLDGKALTLPPEPTHSLQSLLLHLSSSPLPCPHPQDVFNQVLSAPERVLVIFDGFEVVRDMEGLLQCPADDSRGGTYSVRQLFSGLLQRRLLPGCSLLLSARPRGTVSGLLRRADSLLELSGFSPPDIERYLGQGRRRPQGECLDLAQRFAVGLLFRNKAELRDLATLDTGAMSAVVAKRAAVTSHLENLHPAELNPARLLEACHCVYETGDAHLVRQLVRNLPEVLSFQGVPLCPADAYVVWNLLDQCRTPRRRFCLGLEDTGLRITGLKLLTGLHNINSYSLSDGVLGEGIPAVRDLHKLEFELGPVNGPLALPKLLELLPGTAQSTTSGVSTAPTNGRRDGRTTIRSPNPSKHELSLPNQRAPQPVITGLSFLDQRSPPVDHRALYFLISGHQPSITEPLFLDQGHHLSSQASTPRSASPTFDTDSLPQISGYQTNCIGDHGLERLAPALSTLPSLHCLSNVISDGGADSLAAVLPQMTSLSDLDGGGGGGGHL
ncbi:unnamed protein product [Coregonus sp. 'balchen']|nr:unnamed protein product [Coregonus sp. 'balchen']